MTFSATESLWSSSFIFPEVLHYHLGFLKMKGQAPAVAHRCPSTQHGLPVPFTQAWFNELRVPVWEGDIWNLMSTAWKCTRSPLTGQQPGSTFSCQSAVKIHHRGGRGWETKRKKQKGKDVWEEVWFFIRDHSVLHKRWSFNSNDNRKLLKTFDLKFKFQ